MDSIGNSGGCTGYHGIWARSESIDDTISQRLRSSTRSCCGTLVSPITISTFNSPPQCEKKNKDSLSLEKYFAKRIVLFVKSSFHEIFS